MIRISLRKPASSLPTGAALGLILICCAGAALAVPTVEVDGPSSAGALDAPVAPRLKTDPDPQLSPPAAATDPAASEPAPAATEAKAADTAEQGALRRSLAGIPEGTSDEDKKEREALLAFYEARSLTPLWVAPKGLNAKGQSIVATLDAADDWGLEAKDFAKPEIDVEGPGSPELSAEAAAAAEVELSQSALKYARFARGGRIIAPAEQLTTQFDRRPQLVDPRTVLDGLAAADDAGTYLSGLNPKQPQFEKLRQKYLAARKGRGGEARRILANMEMWRWMPDDMGDLHILANVPEFMLRMYENGAVIHSERIVAGELDKQTTIFSRPLKNIVFRPMWRVPESIKVRELWPSLKRGGGLMRQHGLEVETKDGQRLNWRTMDWSREDIRNYEVIQPPGRKSVMGVVKFSFPSQHTIFMHDTPDKWMFNNRQRTLSHGCLRLRNPVRLAELVLEKDKGWDAAKIADLVRNGPLNNEILIDKKIRMHLVYFTAWVDDGGSLKTFPDVYGHEKRVSLALEGKWNAIDKGRDHLAPVEPLEMSAAPRTPQQKQKETAFDDFLGGVFGGF